MQKRIVLLGFLAILIVNDSIAQRAEKKYSRADTLRGSIGAERAWWDIKFYDLHVTPNIKEKTIQGFVDISYQVLQKGKTMQIDLQQPLAIDSAFDVDKKKSISLNFEREGNVYWIHFPTNAKIGSAKIIRLYYKGIPQEAKNPPWDGGVTWSKDNLGNPFISTSCQGLGASIWWPCKDHQSDEPEDGASVSITTPDSLMDVSNGQLKQVIDLKETHQKTWVWEVKNPINNYSLSMNIAKYENFSDTLQGEAGVLPLNFYVLGGHLSEAKVQFQQAKSMLHCFEFWLGKYPFYEDGYKLIEVPYLGMEHQSAVTYGNKFKNGYLGRDLSGTGWGLKWDFIIIHESGHEWFGNNITTKDMADMWIHEGFTNFTETLYTQWLSGKQAGFEYNFGIRKNISNRAPIIGKYGVNSEGGNDKYYKGSNLIQTIRNSIDDDSLFRQTLRNMNAVFYHKTVMSADIETFISKSVGFNYQKVFDQYLRNTSIPVLELSYQKEKKKLFFRWSNCIDGFDLPITFKTDKDKKKIAPQKNNWNSIDITEGEEGFFNPAAIEFKYYIKVKELASTDSF
ncbi:MAG: M1 family metallopeptidase [Bacteroidota bacterium]